MSQIGSILAPVDKLFDSVERITFYNPENGYTVLCGLVLTVANLSALTKLGHRVKIAGG
ncbi:MAG: hypothetical protein R6W69_06360 [Anaerolineales bacterium]|jgi:hypothetical protein